MTYNTFDDFYEPSEADSIIEEYKDYLRLSVKQEVKDEIELLKKELNELKEFRNKKRDYEIELAALKNKMEAMQRKAEQDAKRERLDNILSELNQPAWKVKYVSEYIHDKCDKCDRNRKIHFKSPSGKDLTEDCECAEKRVAYKPEEVRCVRFYTNDEKVFEADFVPWVKTKEGGGNIVQGWEICGDNYAHVKYHGEDFEDISKYSTYFFNKEECQKYCDWLNKN